MKTNRLNSEVLLGAASLVLAGIVYFVTRDLSRFGGVFVNYALGALIFLSVLEIIIGFISPTMVQFFDSAIERNNVFIGLGMLAVYLFFLPKVGFLPSSYVFYACFNLFLAEDRWKTRTVVESIIISAIVVTAFYFIFHHGLEVPLPEAEWFAE